MVLACSHSDLPTSGRYCRKREENCCDQAPENPNSTRNAKTGERWILRKGERAESTYCSQTREQDRLQNAGNIMLNFAGLLPD